MSDRCDRYPIGASLTLVDLEEDLEQVHRRLLGEEPVSWIAPLGMWWVVRDADVRALLADERLRTVSPRSTILDTFGDQMLSAEGADHRRYRRAAQPPFQPAQVRAALSASIAVMAGQLVDAFPPGRVELRAAFAARLPVLTMLAVFGLPAADEALLRLWYDSFEAALANFAGDQAIRDRAHRDMQAFHAHMQVAIESERDAPTSSLLGQLLAEQLDDDAIRRNAAIILFGGISTVEALILNAVWALDRHPQVRARAEADSALWPRVIDETIRWQAPVQSATRHASCAIDFAGHRFEAGEVVNCMLGAANRDSRVWPAPDRFDIDRPSPGRHLGFATGPHFCLGMHLARLQGAIALETLYRRCPGLALAADAGPQAPTGYEFRQPHALWLTWGDSA